MAEKKVTLQIGGNDFAFNVTTGDFNRFVNETAPDNKTGPAVAFLRRALVDKKQREQLDELCDRGAALNIAAKLIQEFQGEIEIEVKK
ncbi:MAG: putative phage tail assembly chaperone [Victivallaceae bacterium]|nr:putative phage tail assembly chaperone [Victivallaceae bacterium]